MTIACGRYECYFNNGKFCTAKKVTLNPAEENSFDEIICETFIEPIDIKEAEGNPLQNVTVSNGEIIAEGEVIFNNIFKDRIEIYHTENSFRNLHDILAPYEDKHVILRLEVVE